MAEFSECDDIIDTRDVQERMEELLEALDLDANGDPNEYDDGDEKPEPLPEDERAELEEELRELNELKADVEAYSGDSFESGITMIADSHFVEYAKDYAEDIYGAEVAEAAWPFDNIDWAGAARDLQQDYTEISFRGYDFWVR
jgi:hypothetical protein